MINNQTTAYACRNYYFFFGCFADKITIYEIRLIYEGNIVKIINGAIV